MSVFELSSCLLFRVDDFACGLQAFILSETGF